MAQCGVTYEPIATYLASFHFSYKAVSTLILSSKRNLHEETQRRHINMFMPQLEFVGVVLGER